MTPAPSRAELPEAGEAAPIQPRVRKAWYIACTSAELGQDVLKTEVFAQPIVLFRDGSGAPGALLDRCPHRSVPLSLGRVVDGQLACGYHGWRFEGDGRCAHVPAFLGAADAPGRRCVAFPTREQQGFVWIWADPGSPPVGEPFFFRLMEDARYQVITRVLHAEGSVHAVAENALDVPHTAFLHGGLFRVDAARNEIRCVVTRQHDRVECAYIGEPRPKGLVGRILSPSGGVVTHSDRFLLPGIAEVEYQIGDENHILVDAALTPERDHRTRLTAVVAVRTRMPLWLIRPFAEPAALRIFGQDQRVLSAQTDNLRRFGEAGFASTELDALGPHILRLMRQAERGELEDPDAAPYQREFSMRV